MLSLHLQGNRVDLPMCVSKFRAEPCRRQAHRCPRNCRYGTYQTTSSPSTFGSFAQRVETNDAVLDDSGGSVSKVLAVIMTRL